MKTFEFAMETFVISTEEQDTELSPVTRHELRMMFPLYPELAH
ncbi:TPA: hypothetical protein ACU5PC_004606 [Klebsiella pneumoniae]